MSNVIFAKDIREAHKIAVNCSIFDRDRSYYIEQNVNSTGYVISSTPQYQNRDGETFYIYGDGELRSVSKWDGDSGSWHEYY